MRKRIDVMWFGGLMLDLLVLALLAALVASHIVAGLR